MWKQASSKKIKCESTNHVGGNDYIWNHVKKSREKKSWGENKWVVKKKSRESK